MSNSSLHVPIRNALDGLFQSLNGLSDVSNILPNDADDWGISDPNAIQAVTETFQKLEQFIKSEAESDYYIQPPVEEIMRVSTIVGQIAHRLMLLNTALGNTTSNTARLE